MLLSLTTRQSTSTGVIFFVILLSVQLIRRGNPENPDTDYSDYVKLEFSVKFLATWPTVLLAYSF